MRRNFMMNIKIGGTMTKTEYAMSLTSEEELATYRPYFPDWSDEDIAEMLLDATAYAILSSYESKYEL